MSNSNQKPKILFIMTGSIACFKACSLLSKLKQNNWDIQVVASEAALKFVGEATLEGLSGKPVVSGLYDRGRMMDHIHLQRWADIILVCPATANYINRIAQGTGDDLPSTLFLAHDFKKPFLLAPAMNTAMYLHPVTQESLSKLKTWGVEVLESASGVLACGESGYGRLLEPDALLAEIESRFPRDLNSNGADHTGLKCAGNNKSVGHLNSPNQTKIAGQTNQPSKIPRVLVTAGGTYEPLDSVRVLTNLSTGKTGQVLAMYLNELGFEVDLLLSELSQVVPLNQVPNDRFSNFESLKQKVESSLGKNHYDVVIHAAAVGDFHVGSVEKSDGSVKTSGSKLDSGEELVVRLKPNPKIVNTIKEISPKSVLVAFKLTSGLDTEGQFQKVSKLFSESHADFVVSNDLTDVLKKSDGHSFRIFKTDKESSQVHNVTALAELLSQLLSERLTGQRG
ncbi:MAG: phosphopantothenoylcysteine decarboxylase [Bdellovibrionota bacterium]